ARRDDRHPRSAATAVRAPRHQRLRTADRACGADCGERGGGGCPPPRPARLSPRGSVAAGGRACWRRGRTVRLRAGSQRPLAAVLRARMDLLTQLALGFKVALTLQNLTHGFLGTVLGTLVGVLPGLGPVATISILLPITFALPAQAALILLAGIYYGAQYGGSTTAILVNLPGESSSVVTTLDGYRMARKGEAG